MQRVSYLLGHLLPDLGAWKKDKDGERPKGTPTLHPADIEYFKFEISSLGAKTILEFGPGSSTELFVSLGLQVTTIEHSDKWYEVAKERFKDCPNVRLLKGEDEMPFVVHGMGSYERFDLALVDAPQGYFPMRKAHKGYEDCSRLNSTLLALQHAPVVLLHDATRPLERGTLNRLSRLGYKIEMIPVPFGMARITNGHQDRPYTSSIAQSRSTSDGPESVSGGVPEPQRSDNGDADGIGSKRRSVRKGHRRLRSGGQVPSTPGAHPGVEGGS